MDKSSEHILEQLEPKTEVNDISMVTTIKEEVLSEPQLTGMTQSVDINVKSISNEPSITVISSMTEKSKTEIPQTIQCRSLQTLTQENQLSVSKAFAQNPVIHSSIGGTFNLQPILAPKMVETNDDAKRQKKSHQINQIIVKRYKPLQPLIQPKSCNQLTVGMPVVPQIPLMHSSIGNTFNFQPIAPKMVYVVPNQQLIPNVALNQTQVLSSVFPQQNVLNYRKTLSNETNINPIKLKTYGKTVPFRSTPVSYNQKIKAITKDLEPKSLPKESDSSLTTIDTSIKVTEIESRDDKISVPQQKKFSGKGISMDCQSKQIVLNVYNYFSKHNPNLAKTSIVDMTSEATDVGTSTIWHILKKGIIAPKTTRERSKIFTWNEQDKLELQKLLKSIKTPHEFKYVYKKFVSNGSKQLFSFKGCAVTTFLRIMKEMGFKKTGDKILLKYIRKRKPIEEESDNSQ